MSQKPCKPWAGRGCRKSRIPGSTIAVSLQEQRSVEYARRLVKLVGALTARARVRWLCRPLRQSHAKHGYGKGFLDPMEMPTRGGGRQGGRYVDLGQKETGRTHSGDNQ